MSIAAHGPKRIRRHRVALLPALVATLLALGGPARAEEKPAEDPPYPHGDFTEDCALCHAPDHWIPASISKEFDHRKIAGFPLEGGHQTAGCRNCHRSLDFKQASPSCASCHRDIHLGELGIDCGRCHTTRNFRDRTGMGRAHERTRFSLTGRHIAADCESCHKPASQGQLQWVNTPVGCYSCHQSDYESATSPNHVALGFPTDCGQCHQTGLWQTATFDHSQSGFPLTGAHTAASCSSCHASGQYDGLSTECVSCHRRDFDATTDPAHKAGGFPQTCTQCHTTVSWSGASFTHVSSFPLSAGHAGVSCQACHGDGVYKGKSTDCYACHRPDYERTSAPAHPAAGFSTTCTQCHTTATWAGASYAHTPRFPLTGGHAAASCQSCHGDGVYAGKSTRCESCHDADYNATTDPPHRQAAFPNDCTLCHTIVGWRPSSFDHGRSQFPLTGAHVGLSCSQCHSNGVYDGKPTDCVSCHRDDFDRTTTPAHPAAGFSTTCTQCHTTATWAGASYAHTARFPLTGGHAGASCQACHGDGIYAGKSTRCESCHGADYNATTDPPHRQAAFPNDCTLCHTIVGWRPSSFDHGRSQFPLTGAHVGLSCSQCHSDGVYDGKPTDCVSCHRDDYQRTTDPGARGGGLLDDLHAVPHDGDLGRRELPAHAALPADRRSRVPLLPGLPRRRGLRREEHAVRELPRRDYNATTDPPHRQAAFPNDCTLCHTIVGWRPSSFDHGRSQFPLTGAHLGLSCSQCHSDGVYDGKPTDCVSCHRDDYQRTTDPAHAAAGFSTTCTQCHTTATWAGASYAHTPRFPLTGGHASPSCAACHGDGVYAGKSTRCESCHTDDYNATTDPNHRQAAFPNDCTLCHTIVGWRPSTFDHGTTQFPLAGAHAGLSCSQCHFDGVYDGKPTDCYSCHRKDYDGATDPNHRQAGFPTDCTVCHTGTTTWSGATYNHQSTGFPLTGAHVPLACSACHADGVYDGKSTACASCHQDDFDRTTDPNHRAAGFAATCQDCHTTVTWDGGRFDHSRTSFPLTGSHVPLACSSCHSDNVYDGKSTACASCHQDDYDRTTDPNHRTAHFPTDCVLCHTTIQWPGARFEHDAQYFPIYSGRHRDKWSRCSDCHTNSNNYADFNCLGCHPHSDKNETDGHHRGEPGYRYESRACYQCHPQGRAD